jgi:rhomboid protease GluP
MSDKPKNIPEELNFNPSIEQEIPHLFKKKRSFAEKCLDVWNYFIPKKDYLITPILVYINVLVFIFMILSGVGFMEPNTSDLLKWGANFRYSTLQGESWRLLTSTFVHGGFFHLLMNVYALVFIGRQLEPLIGRSRFIAAYILSGLIASLASISMHDMTVSVGASGAIFGLYGFFLALLSTRLMVASLRMPLLKNIGLFVAYNLVFGMEAGIDNAAHLGGLVSGGLFGYAYYFSLKQDSNSSYKHMTTGILAVVVSISILVTFSVLPNDIVEHDKKMAEFGVFENKALIIYRMADTTPNEVYLEEIGNKSLNYWKQCIRIVKEMQQLDLPDVFQNQNKLLLEYSEIRLKSYNALYNEIQIGDGRYTQDIEMYSQHIDSILTVLKSVNN